MNKKKQLIAIGISFVFIMFFLLINTGIVNAQEAREELAQKENCQIIRIYKDTEKRVRIEEQTTTIPKGGCVIWVNWSPTQKVDITFEEGKKCEDIVDASSDFQLNNKGCFISHLILPKGETASLVFKKEGTFDYVVTPVGGEKTKGKIIVH